MTKKQRCLIIGTSHAGVQQAFALRKYGWSGDIVLLGDDPHHPYHRPPLSKDFLSGSRTMDQIQLRPAAMFDKSAIDLRLGVTASRILLDQQRVVLADGGEEHYDRLVLATGARVRQLPVRGADLAGVHYLRDVADIDAIQSTLATAQSVVIVGGGYIGLEAAATLRKRGLTVTVLEAADRVLARVTGPQMSEFFERLHREEGVRVVTGIGLDTFEGSGRVKSVALANGDLLAAQMVIVGIGVIPNVELAQNAGLSVDNGIVTDEFGQTSDPHVYAAGDCANTLHAGFAEHLRLESVQNANDQALNVARSLCGQPEPYRALPWFWSDQFDVKLQIAGLSTGYDREVWRGDSTCGREFSACYLQGDRLLAVDAINRPKDFVQARKLIESRARFDVDKLADPTVSLADAVSAGDAPE